MKSTVLLSLLFLVSAAGLLPTLAADEPLPWRTVFGTINAETQLEEKLGRLFAVGLFKRIYDISREQEISANCLLDISPIQDLNLTDPLFAENGISLSLPMNTAFSGLVNGEFHTCDTNITGLSSVGDGLCVKLILEYLMPPSVSIDYSLQTGTLGLSGLHSAALELLLGLLRFSGFGYYDFSVQDVFLDLSLNLTLNLNGMTVPGFAFDLGFSNLSLSAEGSELNEGPFDWEEISFQIQDWFEALWAVFQPVLQYVLKNAVADIVKDCLIIHFIPDTPNYLKCLDELGLGSGTMSEVLGSEIEALFGLNPLFAEDGDACVRPFTFRPIPTTQVPEYVTDLSGAGVTAAGLGLGLMAVFIVLVL